MTDSINTAITEAFTFRHACKDFLPNQKIKDTDFNLILESAHTSPSSFGFEPWKLLVIQDAEIREKLKECAWGGQNQIPHASHVVIILARKGHHLWAQSEYIQNFMKEVQQLPENIIEMKTKFYSQFQKEDFKLKTEAELFDWAKRQTYIPLANMMHNAALLKIDSCPMEGFHEDKTNEILAKYCGVDLKDFGVSVLVAFGYRSEEPHHAKTRQVKEKVVQFI